MSNQTQIYFSLVQQNSNFANREWKYVHKNQNILVENVI